MVTICHISSVFVDSVAVMPRTATVTLPYITAFASAKSAPSVSESEPGSATIGTRKNLSRGAVQRAAPARSLSQTTDSNADHSGAEKLMAIAPASGIKLNAMTVKVCEIDCDTPRARWSRGRCVANTENPVTGMITAAQTMSEENERKNITSPTG